MKSTLVRAVAIFLFSTGTSPAAGVGISVFNGDYTNEGFNDTTPAAPISGNNGQTIGQQRLNAFNAAATFWSDKLNNRRPIEIYAQMDPLPCSSQSGILGSAGATTAGRDFPSAPRPSTYYPIALAQELANQDFVDFPEISAQFNSEIGSSGCLTSINWWYGINSEPPAGMISFFDTVLHEIAHGLGFFTFVDEFGSRLTTSDGQQWDDHFMLHLKDGATNKSWTSMTNTERAASSINSQLLWSGANVKSTSQILNSGSHSSKAVHMYAPSPYEQGSSVSHWDVTLYPDELMEPYATISSDERLTFALLCDIGWGRQATCSTGTSTPPTSGGESKPFVYRMLDLLVPATKSH